MANVCPHTHINVTLTKSAFLSMVTACIEVYRKEALGIMLGERHKKHYLIKEALPYQTAKRGYDDVGVSAERIRRIDDTLKHITKSKVLGFFHSHPDFPAYLSGLDKEEHMQENLPLQLLVVVKKTKRRKKWAFHEDLSISGTIGKHYFVKLLAYELEKKQKSICPIKIVCPFVRNLNMLGKL